MSKQSFALGPRSVIEHNRTPDRILEENMRLRSINTDLVEALRLMVDWVDHPYTNGHPRLAPMGPARAALAKAGVL